MKACLINYCFDPDWLEEYSFDLDLYDRSDDGIERSLTKYGRVFKTPNRGDVDHDKLNWLVENYDNLPDVFLWGKSNIFKYVDKDYFDNALRENKFSPLLKQDHKTYSDKFGEVCKYEGNIYKERADNWYFNNPELAKKNFFSWEDWATHFFLPKEHFVPFAPGGNYILTRDRVHVHSKDLYAEMRDMLPYAQHPAEAHAAERSYFYLWR